MVDIVAQICKIGSDEERMVYGFASVSTEDGKTVLVDRQGDTINEVELVKMAHNFIKGERAGKEMHKGVKKAEVVESIVIRPDVSKALGLPEEFKKTGWFIGMKVHDDVAWDKVKKGDLQAFSIGGKGKRKAIQKDGRTGRDGDGDGQRDEKNNGRGAAGALAGAGLAGYGGSRLGRFMGMNAGHNAFNSKYRTNADFLHGVFSERRGDIKVNRQLNNLRRPGGLGDITQYAHGRGAGPGLSQFYENSLREVANVGRRTMLQEGLNRAAVQPGYFAAARSRGASLAGANASRMGGRIGLGLGAAGGLLAGYMAMR